MRKLLTVCFALLSAPALADECRFYSSSGDESIAIVSDDLLHTFFIGGSEDGDTCSVAPMDYGEKLAACGDWETVFTVVSSVPNGDLDILVFLGQAWYKRCYEPA